MPHHNGKQLLKIGELGENCHVVLDYLFILVLCVKEEARTSRHLKMGANTQQNYCPANTDCLPWAGLKSIRRPSLYEIYIKELVAGIVEKKN